MFLPVFVRDFTSTPPLHNFQQEPSRFHRNLKGSAYTFKRPAFSLMRVIKRLQLLPGLLFVLVPVLLQAQAQNPTWMSANVYAIVMPGNVTFCAGGGANMTVDLQYWWNNVFYETDSGIAFGADGCVTNFYNYDGFAGSYIFTGIRNSANYPNGPWTSIYMTLTLYPIGSQPTINYFYANQSSLNAGECTYLNWGSTSASSAWLFDSGSGTNQGVAATGSLYVCPGATSSYSLTVYNAAGPSANASLTVQVNPLYSAANFFSQVVPSPMIPGTPYTVSVTIQNTGTTTWSENQSIRLDSQNLADNTTWGVSRVYLAPGEAVPPGYNKTFTFGIVTPPTPGTYNFQWQMVRDGVGWFGNPSVNVLVGSQYPQPTSMSFSPTSMNAGNGSYVLTIGNGANMSIDFQYTWSGNPGGVYSATNWGPLDSLSRRTVVVNHGDAQGTYQFLRVKNSLSLQWVELVPAPTFTILPPQPIANSLTLSLSSFTPPGTFTMTAGNAGGITTDTRSNLNGALQPDQLGWPTFSTLADGATGQTPVNASTCTAIGNYQFTGLRNTNLPNKTEADWVPQNGLLSVLCPGLPTLRATSPVVPASVSAGATTAIVIYGTNLCGPTTLSSGNPGITFSNVVPAGDYSGTTVSATVSVSSSVAAGSYAFTLTTPCGQTPSSLGVFVNNADFVSQTVPAIMNPGVTYSASITVKNTGTSTWTAPDNYQLGSQNPQDNVTWGQSRLSLAAGETVPPGATKTFSLTFRAPATPGTYNFQWQMVQNNSQWFGSLTPNIVVSVVPPPTVTSINPNSGNQGQHDIPLAIMGANFTGAQVSVPTSSGIHLSQVNVASPSQITAILDIATTAPVQVVPLSITTPGGTQAVNFSVTSEDPLGKPVVNSIQPTIMLVDTTHFVETFVLSGSNLTNAVVDADPTFQITSVNHVTDTQLHVTVSANVGTAVGTYFFTVRIPKFGSTLARFRVVASLSKPAIESFTPMNPAAGVPYFLQMTGNNLNGTLLTADNPGVTILLGSAEVLDQNSPPDYQALGGLLFVDPSVAAGTAVRLTVTNVLGESDSVVIHVAPPEQIQTDINSSKSATPPFTMDTIPLGTVSSITEELLVQPPQMMNVTSFEQQFRKGNRQNLLSDLLFCDAQCRIRFPLASFRYGIPFIDCGGKLFDKSCFRKLKKGDFRSIHVGFIGVEAILFADLTLASDGSICFLIPCRVRLGWALNVVLPFSKSLRYSQTYPLPGFFVSTRPAPDCTSSFRDCVDPVNVVALPRDSRFCAQVTNMQIQFLAGLISNATSTETCAETTAGFNVELTAFPTTIDPGNPTTLSWKPADSSSIVVNHITILTDTGITVLDCLVGGTSCPASGSRADIPLITTSYTLTANGSIGGDAASDTTPPVRVTVVPNVTFSSLIGVPENGAGNLTVTLNPSPSSVSVTLNISTVSRTGKAKFANGTTTMQVSGTTTISVTGVTRSSTAGNILIQATYDDGNGHITTRASTSTTVVWVTLSMRTGNGTSVSTDNGALSTYTSASGSSNLGTFFSTGTIATHMWRTNVEIVGTVTPSNFMGMITLQRQVDAFITYADTSQINSGGPFADTSDTKLRDDDPQSGGSSGKVYDLDGPGLKNTDSNPVGSILRTRRNFRQWATLNGLKVSDDFLWFSRISVVKNSDGDALNSDVPNDNIAGPGTTNTTWNLQ